jgi:hypothetical protein
VKRHIEVDGAIEASARAGAPEAEAPLPRAEFDKIMAELHRVIICPFLDSELVLDVGMYGVEVERYPTPVILTGASSAPIGWEALEAWHRRTRHRLNRVLPRAQALGYEYQTGTGLVFDD